MSLSEIKNNFYYSVGSTLKEYAEQCAEIFQTEILRL